VYTPIHVEERGYQGGSAGGGLCFVKAQSRTGSWFSFVSKQHIYASPLEFGRADFGGPEVLNRVCLTLFKAKSPRLTLSLHYLWISRMFSAKCGLNPVRLHVFFASYFRRLSLNVTAQSFSGKVPVRPNLTHSKFDICVENHILGLPPLVVGNGHVTSVSEHGLRLASPCCPTICIIE